MRNHGTCPVITPKSIFFEGLITGHHFRRCGTVLPKTNFRITPGAQSALQGNSDFMNKIEATIQYWLYAISSRKVESHCNHGLCEVQSGEIYKQEIITTIVLKLVEILTIRAEVNKQNTNLKVSKDILSFNDLLLNFCQVHLSWHHESYRILKKTKTIFINNLQQGCCQGEGWVGVLDRCFDFIHKIRVSLQGALRPWRNSKFHFIISPPI